MAAPRPNASPADSPLTLALTGDVMLGRLVAPVIQERGFAYPWGNMLPRLHEADLVLMNLECALTSETRQWEGDPFKPFFFRAEPSAVGALQAARVSAVSVANNHIGDFGTPGLLETLHVLDRAGIAHAGAGATLAAARAPARLAAKGKRINVVAFTDHPQAWAAGPVTPGHSFTAISLRRPTLAAVRSAIAAARDADLVVCALHWGPNMRTHPTAAFREFAHAVADAGADLLWGHSAHLVQGIEIHGGKLLLYDTGDFVDDYAIDPQLRNDLSALFLVRLGPRGIERLELVPVRIDHMQVNLATGPDRDWFVRRMTRLCGEMGTRLTDEGGVLSVMVASAAA